MVVCTGSVIDKIYKPFQIFRHIIDDPSFLSVVAEAWRPAVIGDPWFVLATKLKRVKTALIKMNKSKRDLHIAVSKAKVELLQWQAAMPSQPSQNYIEEEAILCTIYKDALNTEECFLKQKARVRWLQLGDGNNKYFHNTCRGKWNTNKILTLEDEFGVIHNTHKSISDAAVGYFERLLGHEVVTDLIDPAITLPTLSDSQKSLLIMNFSDKEVFDTLKHMGKGKSPGPDGFSLEFYLPSWSVVGRDVVSAILFFFSNLHMPRFVNSTAISLVLKFPGASKVTDFRPISCCNILYKCISKMLTSRLKRIIPSIISDNQCAFVPKRNIGDNIMLAQALCRGYHRDAGPPRCVFKLDIQKAFDNISWSFLFNTMERFGFPLLFINWVQICVTSSMSSLKFNGGIEGFFKNRVGLRHGDPLSPYLFVICMEVLTAYLNRGLNSNPDFVNHWRTKDLNLHHLMFADDILIFCKGYDSYIAEFMKCITMFSRCSGLRPNPNKS